MGATKAIKAGHGTEYVRELVKKALRDSKIPLTPTDIKRDLRFDYKDTRVNNALANLKAQGLVTSEPDPNSTKPGLPEHIYRWRRARDEAREATGANAAHVPVQEPCLSLVRRPDEPAPSTNEKVRPVVRPVKELPVEVAPPPISLASFASITDLLDRMDPEYLALYADAKRRVKKAQTDMVQELEAWKEVEARFKARKAEIHAEADQAQKDIREIVEALSRG